MHKYLFIKKSGQYSKILPEDILYIENLKRYVRIITRSDKFIVLSSLGKVALELDPNIFCRIHQSYIISLEHLKNFDSEVVTIENCQLPIGRQYRRILLEKIGILNCDNRKKNKLYKNGITKLLKQIKPN